MNLEDNNRPIAISVNNLNKVFRLPHEQHGSIKSAVVGLFKRRRGFEQQEALKDINFTIKKGEFFAIVGRNGSGKSTLLKLIAGIYTPTRGNIEIVGKLTPFIELGVGFNPELTGRDNVFLNGALLGFDRSEMEAMYKDIVEFAELEKFMDQKLKNYSSGMQVRLAFSIAVRARSDIMLIDEVLAVGDAAFQQKCFDYFESIRERGMTVCFVTHDMAQVRRFCDRAVYIQDGKQELLGTTKEIADRYILDNMESSISNSEDSNSGSYNVTGALKKFTVDVDKKIVSRGQGLKIEIKYETIAECQIYAGISLNKDGSRVAEFNSIGVTIDPKPGKHVFELELDTSTFVRGEYKLEIALFASKTRKLLGFMTNAGKVRCNTSDETTGGLYAINGNWSGK